jgi:hypothetical protein
MSQPEQSQHIIKEEKGNDLHEPAERRKDGQLVNWEINLGLAHLKHTTTTFIYWLHSCLWRHKDSAPQKTTLPYQCFCFQNRLHIFWDALIQKRFFRWRKQFNFRGDLTDISAKKSTGPYEFECTSMRGTFWERNVPNHVPNNVWCVHAGILVIWCRCFCGRLGYY